MSQSCPDTRLAHERTETKPVIKTNIDGGPVHVMCQL